MTAMFQPATYQVVTTHTPDYLDPITVSAGEEVRVTDRVDHWEDNPAWLWVWCVDARGKEGWVPQAYLAAGRMLCDYSATELLVASGEAVTATTAVNGWLWCEHPQGQAGWVPAAKLVRVEDAPPAEGRRY